MSESPHRHSAAAAVAAAARSWGPFGGDGLLHRGYHNYHHHQQHNNINSNDDYRIPHPDTHTMNVRWQFRDTMLQDTADHRRVHAHTGGMMARNILHVLHDRECQGAYAVHPLRRQLRHQQAYSRSRGTTSPVGSDGDKSPATVVESPNSATQATNLYEEPVPTTTEAAARTDDDDDEGDMPERTVVVNNAVTEHTTTHHGTTTATINNNTNENKASPAVDNNAITSLHRVEYPTTIEHEVRVFAEYATCTRYHSAFLQHLGGDEERDEQGNRPESSKAVSTISVAFAPDSQTIASTHGDHTVKISSCATGRLLQSLEGHPRTPWTVKYHPSDASIIASGCLGHQVRVWNWPNKQCLQMVRLDYAIISVSFHPTGKLLAIANGTRLHFWGLEAYGARDNSNPETPTATSADSSTSTATINRSPILTEIDQRHMLRCVHFPPDGKTIIIGGVNPISQDPRRRHRGGIGGGGMSFYLRLWDFDLALALKPPIHLPAGLPTIRRAISNPRTFVPRALLYNDGGFDVSPDGKTLCACAEYWLPEGVDNAMDLLVKKQRELDASRMETQQNVEDDHGDNNDQNQTLSIDTAGAAQSRTIAETHSAVSAALMRLKSVAQSCNQISHGRSPSFREGMDTVGRLSAQQQQQQPGQPPAPSDIAPTLDYVPRTPPIPREQQQQRLSPPSPPGRRFVGVRTSGGREVVNSSGTRSVPDGNPNNNNNNNNSGNSNNNNFSTPPPPPPPPPPQAPRVPPPQTPDENPFHARPPHPLSVLSHSPGSYDEAIGQPGGRYVPHVVTVSLETAPLSQEFEHRWPHGGAIANGYQPRLGQLIGACPLDPSKASAVTCVKFSPSTDFCLIGYGVREPEGGGKFHPVTALYRIRGGMAHVSTMLSEIDDVNIARFHPDSGHGFVYGTKQGRVRVLSPRPWNFYNCY